MPPYALRWPLTSLVTLSLLSLPACESDDEPEQMMSTGTGSGSGSADETGGVAGACAEQNATVICDPSCDFNPDAIDCELACQHIATQCLNPDCTGAEHCIELAQEVGLCMVACGITKNLSCTNVVFGCWAEQGHESCGEVGDCLSKY